MTEENSRLVQLGEKMIKQVLEFGINGRGPLSGAEQVAEEHLLSADGDRERAIERLIATHLRMAAASGFVTGLGGVALLPVMVPASLGGLHIIATRMTAAIAHLRGYDISTQEVQSAVGICLLGASGAAALRKAGVEIGRKSTAAALQKVPGRVLIEINKKVGFRLVTKAGQKGAINLVRIVPIVGGGVGATVDVISCRAIATYALTTFEPDGTAVVYADAEIIDAEVVHPATEA
ncbi:MAG: EcsC family protein [Actinomycetota bacterium]|nr:EcsC family protein [Actinomycetota bacterium]